MLLSTVGSKELSIIRYFQFCPILSVNFEKKLFFVNRSDMICNFFSCYKTPVENLSPSKFKQEWGKPTILAFKSVR